jgi:hypothetical protein
MQQAVKQVTRRIKEKGAGTSRSDPGLFEESEDSMSKTVKDIDAALALVAEMREVISQIPGWIAPPPSEAIALLPRFVPGDERAEDIFEIMALAEALQSVTTELEATIAAGLRKSADQAMDLYYWAEEMIEDPQHAELIPFVEYVRKLLREVYGMEVRPKKK